MRIRKWFVLFTNIVIIGIGVVFAAPKTAYGAIVNSSDIKIQGSLTNTNTNTNTPNIDPQTMQQSKTIFDINEQLQRMNQALQDNQQVIAVAEHNIDAVYSEIKQLEQEMADLKEKMKKRDIILKERALSYQKTGGNLSYLEVLLGSANFSEFIDRAGTVAKIVQADRDLFEQQKAEIDEFESKHLSLETKLIKLNSLKTEYEGMQAQTIEQQKQYERLKEQFESPNQEQTQADVNKTAASDEAVAPNLPSVSAQNQGRFAKVIQASSKYIGHSVYVFGGGRTAADIQNGRFDCSGYVHWALSQVGIDVGTSTDSIKNSGKQVSEKDLQPGDLVFFDTYKRDGHVGIYIGNGQFIGSQSSTGVAIADMTKGYWKEKFKGRVIRL